MNEYTQQQLRTISRLQSAISKGRLEVDAPCGPEPLVKVLGGVHARIVLGRAYPGEGEAVLRLAQFLVNLG